LVLAGDAAGVREVQSGDDLGEAGLEVLVVRPAPAGSLAHDVTRSTNQSVSAASSAASWSRVATWPESSRKSRVNCSLPTCSRNRSPDTSGTTRSWADLASSTGTRTCGSASTRSGQRLTKEWNALSGSTG